MLIDRISDNDLVRLIQNQNLDALKELYARYERLTYSLAMKILKNTQEAEEVVQDVFMKLWNKSTLYNPEGSSKFSSWLISVTLNAAKDKLKSRKDYVHLDGNEIDLPDLKIDLDIELEVKSIKECLRFVLGKLPKEQREIIELLYFEGFSQSQIAERLAIPLGTVKSRTRLAMTKLKKLLNGEEEGVCQCGEIRVEWKDWKNWRSV